MLNAELLNMIPEMVEKYDMEIEKLGGSERQAHGRFAG